nr:DUF262 domain-containing protein [uncultured Campylobacter sp.]
MENIDKLEKEIENGQRNVSYDTKEYTIEIIVKKYLENLDKDKNEFFVPDYQREFTWDDYRQSRFIESLLIGLPIPYIFLAETKEGRYEIVDGSQRIRTLEAFLNNKLTINNGLEILGSLGKYTFDKLSPSRQRKFKNISLKMIVLSDRTSDKTKNEIFERINRGSDLLKDMEKRKGIYRGKFNDFLYKMAQNEQFKKLTPIAHWFEKRQEREELLLRYFALTDMYPKFENRPGIAKQLDEYMDKENTRFKNNPELLKIKEEKFLKMIDFVSKALPNGFSKKGSQQVSRLFFEAISVGVTLAIDENNNVNAQKINLEKILKSDDFLKAISGDRPTHSKDKINKRIELVKKYVLNGNNSNYAK